MFVLGNLIEAWGYRYGFLMIVTFMITLTLVPLIIILIKDIHEVRKDLK